VGKIPFDLFFSVHVLGGGGCQAKMSGIMTVGVATDFHSLSFIPK
jgi:hypothetical protein